MHATYEDQTSSDLLELAAEGFPNVTLRELVHISSALTAKLMSSGPNDQDRAAWLEVSCQALKNAVAAATLTSNADDLRLIKSCLESFNYALEDALRTAQNDDSDCLMRYQKHTRSRMDVIERSLQRMASLHDQECDIGEYGRRPLVH